MVGKKLVTTGIALTAMAVFLAMSGCLGGIDCDQVDFEVSSDNPNEVEITNTGEEVIEGLVIEIQGETVPNEDIDGDINQILDPGDTANFVVPRYEEIEVYSSECPEVVRSGEIDPVELPEIG